MEGEESLKKKKKKDKKILIIMLGLKGVGVICDKSFIFGLT